MVGAGLSGLMAAGQARPGVAGQPQVSPHNLLSYLTITATVAPARTAATANRELPWVRLPVNTALSSAFSILGHVRL